MDTRDWESFWVELPGDMIRGEVTRSRKGFQLSGTREELYELAHDLLDKLGMPNLIPSSYSGAVSGVEVCAICGEDGCTNC